MSDHDILAETARRTSLVAPASRFRVGGVCPKGGYRHTGSTSVSAWTVGEAGMFTGHRSWMSPIT